MKVSIIIAIYRDVRALQVIMESIKSQTVLPYEIIVAEDGNSVEVAEYIKTVDAGAILLKHTSHEDRGWRKTTSLN
ncbi:MAG: glycosyl transferase family 2, partial [Kiritimatiellaeota bacterium]|nr:glycosyl transferase family 2 [Kiritimatiellota bacterium]